MIRHRFFASRRFIITILFFATAALYIRTTAPTLGGGFDSEEFQHVAYTLSVAHATGYPLYLLLGKIFTTLVPIGNIAYRMNLLSALLTAGVVALVYLNAFTLTRRQIPSVAAAALFATNPAVWRQAGVASVGPLHLLLVAAIVYAMLLWHEKRAPLSLAAFLFGLGLAHHRTVLLLAPAIAVFVLLADSNTRSVRRPRDIARCILWLGVPLLLYLYLPIFGGNSPWYSNTLQGFIAELSGGDAGDFLRTSLPDIAQGIVLVSQYLFDSFGYVGGLLIIIGVMSAMPRWNRRANNFIDSRIALFLALATLPFAVWGTLYGGEPDRYLVMPFMFLIYWFVIGAGAVEHWLSLRGAIFASKQSPQSPSEIASHTCPGGRCQGKPLAMTQRLRAAQAILAIVLVLVVILPLGDRFRISDWSTFDRVYKQWDEIFTLPIPRGAVLVGNWPQLNAMRYLQRVEARRPDLQFVGTYYDPAPQTQAARDAFVDGRSIFLAPGIAQPTGDYRYALLGPLLEVRDAPQRQAPANATREFALTPALTLSGFEITTALEPFAPTQSIAPSRTARVALDWRANDSLKDFVVRLSLFDPEGRLIAQKDEPPVRGLYPVSQWQRGEYINDVHNFLIPAGSPPGKYEIKLQTLDGATKAPMSDEVALDSLNIARATSLTRDQVFIQHPLDLTLDNRIALWGCGGCDSTHHAGEMLGVSLVFGVREDVAEDVVLNFALLDQAGKTVQTWQRAPIAFYPSREWHKGEVLKAYFDLELPRDLPTGILVFTTGASPQTMVSIGKSGIEP